jgi:plasmid stabilization system protein ParE
MKIRFSNLAQVEYKEIVIYLFDTFGIEKAEKFEIQFKDNLRQLKQFPYSYSNFFETDKRKFMVNPYITVVYNINEELGYVEILTFWFNRSDPQTLLKHLK